MPHPLAGEWKIMLWPFLAGILTFKTMLQDAQEYAIFIQKIETFSGEGHSTLPRPPLPAARSPPPLLRRLDPRLRFTKSYATANDVPGCSFGGNLQQGWRFLQTRLNDGVKSCVHAECAVCTHWVIGVYTLALGCTRRVCRVCTLCV